jgi:hypothetical protein
VCQHGVRGHAADAGAAAAAAEGLQAQPSHHHVLCVTSVPRCSAGAHGNPRGQAGAHVCADTYVAIRACPGPKMRRGDQGKQEKQQWRSCVCAGGVGVGPKGLVGVGAWHDACMHVCRSGWPWMVRGTVSYTTSMYRLVSGDEIHLICS